MLKASTQEGERGPVYEHRRLTLHQPMRISLPLDGLVVSLRQCYLLTRCLGPCRHDAMGEVRAGGHMIAMQSNRKSPQ